MTQINSNFHYPHLFGTGTAFHPCLSSSCVCLLTALSLQVAFAVMLLYSLWLFVTTNSRLFHVKLWIWKKKESWYRSLEVWNLFSIKSFKPGTNYSLKSDCKPELSTNCALVCAKPSHHHDSWFTSVLCPPTIISNLFDFLTAI